MIDKRELVLGRPLRILSLGVEEFALALRDAGVPVTHLDWQPPAGGDLRLIGLLDALADDQRPMPLGSGPFGEARMGDDKSR